MSGFSVDGEAYYIEYEGLHLLCSECGFYGHRLKACPERKKNDEQQVLANTNPEGGQHLEGERVVP